MPVSREFEEWALGYAGCDGGDAGSRANPSIWVCGIEWGGVHKPDDLRQHVHENVRNPPPGYGAWQLNIQWIYNWQLMKLLAALRGWPVSKYKEFAEEAKPFVEGSAGYFKMNLYPIAFRNTGREHWVKDFSYITGFSSKVEYVAWCNEKRLPQICEWARFHVPELVICLGKTFRGNFATAFSVRPHSWVTEVIDEREISWAVNEEGTLVFVLPFMVNRNGLVRNASIQKFGKRIAELRQPNVTRTAASGAVTER